MIDPDKLRALDEVRRAPGLSMPGEPAWLIERDKRENARKQLTAALLESLPAILAMAEENARMREALEPFAKAADELEAGYSIKLPDGFMPHFSIPLAAYRNARDVCALGEEKA